MKYLRGWVQGTGYILVFAAMVATGMAACGGGGSSSADAASTQSDPVSATNISTNTGTSTGTAAGTGTSSASTTTFTLQVTEMATGLNSPWGMAFLPDGKVLVTERGGTLRIVNPGGTVSAAITGVPAVNNAGQGGLLDVALDPAYASNQRIYLSFSENDATNASINSTAVARAKLDAAGLKLTEVQVIYRQLPKVASSGHYGSRLVFDKNGYLFVTLGDRQSNEQRGFAQDLARGNGKVVRITTDGAAAPGNPFAGNPAAQPEIWSYGHRNPQGAALNPSTGELWVNEHGPQGGDELNQAQAGKNYGWPVISWGQEYGTTTQIGEGTAKAGMEQPVSYWITSNGTPYTGGAKSSIAPSGMAVYTADKFPEYRGNIFIGALAGTALWRIALGGADGKTEVFRERLLASRGERIRDVRVGPDGWLYLLTDGAGGKLLRVSR
jgi:aldose sugar dehydrogenase